MTERELATRVRLRAERARVVVGRETAAQLAAYVAFLLRWNERMNLTRLDGGDAGLDRLVIEPLIAVRQIPVGAASMVDIGSGGGSPAIPIKIARPDLRLRMVEGKVRKAAFLREAVRRLKLDNVVVEHCRYEDLEDRPELHESHDVLTVRAVRVDAKVVGSLEGLVMAGGTILLFCARGQAGVGRDFAPPLVVEEGLQVLESTGCELVVVRKVPVEVVGGEFRRTGRALE